MPAVAFYDIDGAENQLSEVEVMITLNLTIMMAKVNIIHYVNKILPCSTVLLHFSLVI